MTAVADPIRVEQFVTLFECGGTERQFLNLGLALDGRGFGVGFGCIRRTGRLLKELTTRDIPVREYPMRSFYSPRFFRQQWAYARDLAQNRVQIVHAYNLYGNVFAVPAARLAGVPVVIASIRDRGVYLTDWTRWVQRQVCRLADAVVVNAESIREWLVSDGYDPARIHVIRNGVDLDRYLHAPAPDGSLRRELGIPADAPLLSIIARLCPSKGFDVLIDAMPIVHARHPETRLLVVGERLNATRNGIVADDSYRASLAQRARELGIEDRVIFTGYRADVPRILREVTLAVQPSLTEGLSNSVLEAMAAGAAVVATPVGGTPEVMTHGKTGWLVPPGNPAALGDAICHLIEQPSLRAALGPAAQAHVRDTLSVDQMVQATAQLYGELLAESRRGRTSRSPGGAAVLAHHRKPS